MHRGERLLRCHYCDYQSPIPRRCPACGSENIRELGIGTERVAEEVARLFPAARVLRMDSDTTTRVGDHARILSEFEANGDVLVGTQMVAKGLDYPTVTLAAVVAADIGLNVPDFRAAERSFALIAQVCGRSGRMRRGEAIVQTYAPRPSGDCLCRASRLRRFCDGGAYRNASFRAFRRRSVWHISECSDAAGRASSNEPASTRRCCAAASGRRSARAGAVSDRARQRRVALSRRGADAQAGNVAARFTRANSAARRAPMRRRA